MLKINSKQLDLLQGFFLYIWSFEEDKRLGKPRKKNEFGFWAEQLDGAGISWGIQNTVARLAEVRSNSGFYLRTLLEKEGIKLV